MLNSKTSPITLLLLTIPYILLAQNLSESNIDKYDIQKKRLLVFSSAWHLYMASQGQIDLDSATIIFTKTYNLSRLLPYNEVYDSESSSEGDKLINAGKIKDAKALLWKTRSLNEKNQLSQQLSSYYLFKPSALKPDLDSAFKYITLAKNMEDRSKSGSSRAENLNLLGNYYIQSGDFAKAQSCFAEMMDVAIASKNQRTIAIALERSSFWIPFGSPEKIAMLTKARHIYQSEKMKEKEIEVLSKILTARFVASPASAIDDLKEVVRIEKEIGFKHTHVPNLTLAYIYAFKDDFFSALEFAKNSLETINETGDTLFLPFAELRMGNVSSGLGYLNDAIKWYQKSLQRPKSRQTQVFWYRNFIAEAMTLIFGFDGMGQDPKKGLEKIKSVIKDFPPETPFEKMQVSGMQGLAYDMLKDEDKATYHFDIFTKLGKSFPAEHLIDGLSLFYSKIGIHQIHIGNLAEAHRYLELAISTQRNFATYKGQIAKLRYKLDSAQGNFEDALKNYQDFTKHELEVFNVSRRRQMLGLEVQFQTKQKDQNIKILRQTDQIQKARIKEGDFIRNIILVASLLISIIAALLYYQFRLKQRSNHELQTKQNEITRKNSILENLLEEKEWLLREVHHRVKNNLHTVISLLESQSAYLEADALFAIQDSTHRIQAMSLIHQKLYTAENTTTIEMSSYVEELVTYLCESFSVNPRIRIQVDVSETEMDVSQAIPVGLILNEAITNALKYAFPGNMEGIIKVSLKELLDGRYKLSVNDNGIGLKSDFDKNKVSSLGMKLMKGLSTEIHAEFNINGSRGTSISLLFKADRSLMDIEQHEYV